MVLQVDYTRWQDFRSGKFTLGAIKGALNGEEAAQRV